MILVGVVLKDFRPLSSFRTYVSIAAPPSPVYVRAEILSWVSTIPPEKLLVKLFPGRRKKSTPYLVQEFRKSIFFV